MDGGSVFSFGVGDRMNHKPPREDGDAFDDAADPAADLPGDKTAVTKAPPSVKSREQFASQAPLSTTGLDRLKQTTALFETVRAKNERTLRSARRTEALGIRDDFLEQTAKAAGKDAGGAGYRVNIAGFSDASNMGTGWDSTPTGRPGTGPTVGGRSNKALHIQALLQRPVLLGLGDALLDGVPEADTDLRLKMLQCVAKRLPSAMRPYQEAAIRREHAAEMAAYVDSLLYRGDGEPPCSVCLYFDVVLALIKSHAAPGGNLGGYSPVRDGGSDDEDSGDGLGDTAAPSAKRRRGVKTVSQVYLGAARWTAATPSKAEATQALVDLTMDFIKQMGGITEVSWASAAHLFNCKLLPAMMQEQTGVWSMLRERHPDGSRGLMITAPDVQNHLVTHMRWPRAQLAALATSLEREIKDLGDFGSKLRDGATGEETVDTRVTATLRASRQQLLRVYEKLEESSRHLELEDCLTGQLPGAPTETVEAAGAPEEATPGKKRRGRAPAPSKGGKA